MTTISLDTKDDEKALAAAPNKHRQKSERTRLAIMDAAEPLFAPSGMAGASMRQIAKAAGVDMSLVAYHFESKAILFRAVVNRIIADFAERRERMLEDLVARVPEPTPVDLFDIQISAFLDLRFSGQQHRARLIYNRFHQSDETFGEATPSDPFVLRFLAAMERAASHKSPEYVHWAYHGIMGSLFYYMASSGRIARISAGRCNIYSRGHIREAVLNSVRKQFADDGAPSQGS